MFSFIYILIKDVHNAHKNTRERRGRYQFNVEARSRNRSCRGKRISITYSESVFVALGIQHAMAHVPHCQLFPARSTTFFHSNK
jgi:hypothetical protein